MLRSGKTYDEVYHSFRWRIPEFYNIGVDICDKWAHQRYRLALTYEDENGRVEKYTFWDLKRLSDKLANALRAFGINPRDRVGIFLTQCPETAISHIAVYKIGAIAIPLFTLFGTDALEYRLVNSEAKAIFTDGANLDKVVEIWGKLPHLKTVIVTKGRREEKVTNFWESIAEASSEFKPLKTKADDPALIIYTSGLREPRVLPRGPSTRIVFS